MVLTNDTKSFSSSTGRWNLGWRIILSALVVGIIWLEFAVPKAHGFQVCARQCAFGDAACAAAIVACETKIHAYNIYMAQMGEGVPRHQLPAVYRDILGPGYPQANLTTFRFGFADRQPPNNATTDCNTTYFNNADYVQRLRDGSANPDYFWLLHEVAHAEQCAVFGGREAYAKRWWDEMEAAANAQGRQINFNQSPEALANQIGALYAQVHDGMPMEQQADKKANALLPGLRACCIAQGGAPIRPMVVSGIGDRSDGGSSTRRILMAQVTNGDPPFTSRWRIRSPGDSGFIEQPQNLIKGLELLWTPKNNPANAEIVKTQIQTRRRWRHEIQVEITQQSASLGRGTASRTIVIDDLVSITPLGKGPNVPKLPAELPPSQFPGSLPTPVPSKPGPEPRPSPNKPPFGP